MDNDSLAERGRALEDDYFRKKDRELIERIAAALRQSSPSSGPARLNDPRALQELHDLGFSLDTVGLLPLVPALQTVWAEGGVTAADRQLFLDLARARGISQDGVGGQQLTEWVARRPDDAVFSHANRLIRALLDAGAPMALSGDIVTAAEQVAAAGSILGLAPLSAQEKTLLAQLRRRSS